MQRKLQEITIGMSWEVNALEGEMEEGWVNEITGRTGRRVMRLIVANSEKN